MRKKKKIFARFLPLLPGTLVALCLSTQPAAAVDPAIQYEALTSSYGSAACSPSGINGADWDTIGECRSSVWNRGPFVIGATSDSCSSTNEGMLQYTGTLFEYCNGTSWTTPSSYNFSYTAATNGKTTNQGVVALGGNIGCYVASSGNTYCMGTDSYLGNTLTDGKYTSTPLLVSNPLTGSVTWQKVSLGEVYSCGLTTGNAIYCWGANAAGQLGTGDTTTYYRPTALASPYKNYLWADVAVTGTDSSNSSGYGVGSVDMYAACGVTALTEPTGGGKIYCWGNNAAGQLGNGTTTASTTPTAATIGTHIFAKLARTTSYYPAVMCAIADATDPTNPYAAYCWGGNNAGQTGTGTAAGTNVLTPTIVSGGNQWSMLALGTQTTCGVTKAGVGYCWGNGSFQDLGTGSGTNTTAPGTKVGGAGASYVWSEIIVGDYTSMGITTAGSLYGWGQNPAGIFNSANSQNSLPTATTATTPPSTTTWSDVATSHGCGFLGITTGGAVYSLACSGGVGGTPNYGSLVTMQ